MNNRLNPEDVRAEAVACRRDIDTARHWLNSLREKPDETGTVRMTVYFYIEKSKKATRSEPSVSLPMTAYGKPGPDGGSVPPDIADRRALWDALINTVSAAGHAISPANARMKTVSVLFFCISTFLVHDEQHFLLPVSTGISHSTATSVVAIARLHVGQSGRLCRLENWEACGLSRVCKSSLGSPAATAPRSLR